MSSSTFNSSRILVIGSNSFSGSHFVKEALEDGKYLFACDMLHDPAFIENVGVEVEMLPSWEMIPNPRLDPYGGRFYENSENQGEVIEEFKEQIGWEDTISSEEE